MFQAQLELVVPHDEEEVQARHLLNEEIRDLEAAVAKKQGEVASSSNPLIRVRRVHFALPSILLIAITETIRRCLEKVDVGSGDEAKSAR